MPGGATTAAADPIILEAIGKRYETASGAVQAVDSVSLTVRAEEFVTLLGPSGCGKSTVLGMIAGLVRPDAGRVLVAGVPCVGPNPEQVALVFQDGGLFPWRTALDNVTFGLELRGVPAAKRREIALGLLEPMGLRGFERKYPRELSGGMRQRVAIARALAVDPKILLLDEPLGALDALTRIEMQSLLESVWQEEGFTAVLVTHDVTEAVMLGDRVVLIEDGIVKLEVDVPIARPRRRGSPQVAALEERILRHLFADGGYTQRSVA